MEILNLFSELLTGVVLGGGHVTCSARESLSFCFSLEMQQDSFLHYGPKTTQNLAFHLYPPYYLYWSIYKSNHLSIHLSPYTIYLSLMILLSIKPSIHVNEFNYTYIFPAWSFYLSNYPYLHQFHTLIYQTIHPFSSSHPSISIQPSIHSSIKLSILPSILILWSYLSSVI